MGYRNLAVAAAAFVLSVTASALRVPPVVHNTPHASTADDDRVKTVPGLSGPIGFGMYSGYVPIDNKAGRALFYILTERSKDPDNAPLVLWLNGGPGCSSIGGGFMSELGPFLPLPDGTMKRNTHAWNNAANILFLDSPAFVGFSISNSSADKVVGDARTAADARLFLLGFLKKFPKYAHRPLYLTGESYAGHYIPNLAKAILDGNTHGVDPAINLKGIMVGNPWTDANVDNYGAAFMWWTHALISTPTFETLKTTCNMSGIGPIRCDSDSLRQQQQLQSANPSADPTSSSSADADECEAALESAMDEMGNINIYQVYADVCEPREGRALAWSVRSAGVQNKVATFAARALLKRSQPAGAAETRVEGAFGEDAPATSSDDSGFPSEDACVDEEVEKWLNRDDVQTSLHTLKVPFHICTDDINYSGADVIASMLPVYDALLATGLQIMIYSGDVDGIVPTTGTRAWVEGLGLPVKAPWRPWLSPGKGKLPPQVGGYVTEYDGLTFATVRGAGHMVPYVQPQRGLQLFEAFLSNTCPTAAASESSLLETIKRAEGLAVSATRAVGERLEQVAERAFGW